MRKFVRTRGGATASQAASPAASQAASHAPPHASHNGVNGGVRGNGNVSGNGDCRSIPRSHTPVSRAGTDGWDGPGRGGTSGALWVDEEFQGWRALADKKIHNVTWLRVTELSAYPRFFGDERVRHGAAGGSLGSGGDDDDSDEDIYDDCPERWEWQAGELGCAGALAAAAALAATPRLLRRVAPPCDLRAAAGRVRFRLWDSLGWREVAVDDRLATRRGRLLGARGSAPHDYTLALLEKALAKLAGGYARLRGAGWGAGGALRALTGGVLLAAPLSPAAARALLPPTAPLATIILVHNEDYSSVGVVCGLARVRGGAVLVRLRRLRGTSAGGAGAGGALWRSLPAPDRDLLAARLTHPCDSWLSLEEVCRSATRVALCALAPEQLAGERALRGRRAWRAWAARRAWRRGASAGGPPPHAAAAANPRFQLQLSRPALLLAALAQAGRPVPAGVALYRLDAGGGAAGPAAGALPAATREAAQLWRLAAGRYVLVPYAPRHHSAPFLLRLLTDVPADAWEMDEDNLLLRDISEDFLEENELVPPDLQKAAAKLLGGPYVEEVSVATAAEALRRAGAGAGAARALAALRGTRTGCVRAADLPALAALAHAWAAAWLAAPLTHRCGRARCSYGLRGVLRAAGVCASNRVLLAAAPASCRLSRARLLQVLARIHLAHERFRRLDNSIKNNPITLEEMILMTLYS